MRQIYFLVEGGGVTIECSDWSEQTPYNDQFNVGIISNELETLLKLKDFLLYKRCEESNLYLQPSPLSISMYCSEVTPRS